MNPDILVPVPENMRVCTACGKQFEKDALIVKDGDLCPECRKTYGGMAFLYCNTCCAVVTRVTPGILGNGFLIKPGDLLHVNECPVCKPSLATSGEETVPEEVKAYEKSRRL